MSHGGKTGRWQGRFQPAARLRRSPAGHPGNACKTGLSRDSSALRTRPEDRPATLSHSGGELGQSGALPGREIPAAEGETDDGPELGPRPAIAACGRLPVRPHPLRDRRGLTALYVCHCLECRRQSASAFGISVIVRGADLRLVRGAPRRWSRPADSGRVAHCHFCPDCGSRLWHGDREAEAEVSVKGSSLDRPVDLGRAIHIWTTRKLPGVMIPPNARCYPGEPD